MRKSSIADINKYLQKALHHANKFIREEDLQIHRYQRLQRYHMKYFELFEQKISLKFVLLLAPFIHIFSVAQEGIVVQPIAIKFTEGVIPINSQYVASLIVVALLFGCTLFIGHYLHKISLQKDQIVPGKFIVKNITALTLAVLLSIIYLLIIYRFLLIANNWAGGYQHFTSFIVIFGILELLFGLLAISGWELILAFIFWSLLKWRYRRGENSLLHHSRLCSFHFRYFKQMRSLLNPLEQNAFSMDVSLEKILITVSYYERYLGNHNNTKLLT